MAQRREETRQYREFLEHYELTKEFLTGKMEGTVQFRSLFDEDFSWDQMFSKRADINPAAEVLSRVSDVEHAAETEGRNLARTAVARLDEMTAYLCSQGAQGREFLYHMLRDYYIPVMTDAQASLVNNCIRMRRRNEELLNDLAVTREETAAVSRLSGERESRAIRFLEAADDYLFHVAREQQSSNLIRVISTILQRCEAAAPGARDSGREKADDEAVPDRGFIRVPVHTHDELSPEERIELSYPRRCTVTTEDGIHFSVDASDGIDRYFSPELTLEQALSAVKNLLTQ